MSLLFISLLNIKLKKISGFLLKPHLSKYFLHITDPDFFPKLEHLIPLYKNPSENLFCFDECPGIQILQRLVPDLITDEMRKRLEEFEYARNGTIDVFAFLQVKTGKVFAECRPNHQKETLIEVFEKHLKTLPKNEKIHYIMDNLASHSCYELCILIAKYSYIECPAEKNLNTAVKRREWLQCENKRIVFHYTPFHGSWLNMVEIWFGILNQKCLLKYFKKHHKYKTWILKLLLIGYILISLLGLAKENKWTIKEKIQLMRCFLVW